MKILIVGGTWNREKAINNSENNINSFGKPSGLVYKMYDAIKYEDVTLYNGGYYDDLESILQSSVNYDVVFWMANVSNDYPKIREVKEVAPHVMLVSSKRNDGDKYSFLELAQRAIAMKANLTIEFKKLESGLFHIMVFDPLGSVWYEGDNINHAVKSIINRLSFLLSITRQTTIKSEDNKNLMLNWYFDRFKQQEYPLDDNINIHVSDEYLKLIVEYSKRFHEIMKPNNNLIGKNNTKELPSQVFRCTKGMPSFRSDKYIIVSKRRIYHQYITKDDFLATYMQDGKLFYTGDEKPSVDTPVHIKLYEQLKNINYILHSHNYINEAVFTKTAIPCGAIEESDEIIRTILKYYGSLDLNKYAINLKGHGSFILGNTIDDIKNINYIGRPLPERM